MAQLPEQPDGATAPVAFYERAAALAREHDFVLASDEAYSELYFGAEPPASALQVADRTNVLVFNTLSKRSSMPGYRTGFAAGDPEVVAALQRYRPNAGIAPLEMVQRAAVAAGATRRTSRRSAPATAPSATCCCRCSSAAAAVRRRRRDVLPLARRGPDAEALAQRLIEGGVIVTPGSYFGAAGEGFLRMALVPPLADCERAVSLLEGLL